MPQMSPYNWFILFLIITAILMMLSITLNFLIKKYPTQYKKLKKKINKYWKW